jgi:hypothetical protein
MSDGRIVIADGASAELRFFGATGIHLMTSGGRGDGPGEFRDLSSISRFRGDSLAVNSGGRVVSLFDGTGKFLFAVSHAVGVQPGQARPELRQILATFADAAAYVGSIPQPEPRERGARWLATFPVSLIGRDGSTTRALGELPLGVVAMDARPMLPWLSAPLSIASNDSLFFIGLGTEYSIMVYDRAGRLSSIFRRNWSPVRITAAVIDQFVVEWGRRWIRSTGADAERERADLRDDPYATEVPAYSQFLADHAGRLWVRAANVADAPGAGQLNTTPLVASVWSVFNPDGGWLCDVTLPARFMPNDIGADYVLGVSRDSDGVETVVQYRLRSG